MSDFRIVDHQDMDLSAAMFVLGFPSAGFMGTIATNFLVESLKLERVASVLSDTFPPMSVVRGGVSLSPMRIHAAPMVCGLDGECSQLAVLVSEISPQPPRMYPLAHALLDWAKAKDVREIVCLEGVRVEDAGTEVGLYGVAGGPEAQARVKGLEVKPLMDGVVSGFSGALLHLGETVGIPVLCLLAATSGEQQDARAAAEIVDVLNPMVPKLTIDPEPLKTQAEAMDRQIKQLVQRHEESMKDISEQSRHMYG